MKLFNIMDTTFENFDTSVKTYLSKALGSIGVQYSDTQIFAVIFKGIKGVMQNAMFYIEDAMIEQNIFTANRKKSIYSLAKISGYEPYYGSAATGILLSRLNKGVTPESGASKIYLKNGTALRNESTGVTYVVVLPTDYYVYNVDKPLITHELKIVQGYWTSSTYTGSGYYMESIHIDSSNLYDNNYLEVSVNGEIWKRAANFYDMQQNAKEYVVTVGYDNTFDVTFGNITYGKPLSEGDAVIVKYITHSGTTGNISVNNNNTKFTFIDNGTDSKGNGVNLNNFITLTVKSPISGGTNSDSVSLVKSVIGCSSRSLVLANEDNFKLFLRRFSFVGNMNIWSENDSMIVYICCLANYNLYGNISNDTYLSLTDGDLVLTDDQKEMVISTLQNSKKTFAGVSIRFEDPIIRKYACICYVKTNNEYYKETISSQIQNIIIQYFINLEDNTSFISRSSITQLILNNVSNIEFFDFNFISHLCESCYIDGYYDKYTCKYINNEYQYTKTKVFYEDGVTPGLDDYGNIKLDSNLEIPILHGGFKYYYDKTDQGSSINMNNAVEIIWV